MKQLVYLCIIMPTSMFSSDKPAEPNKPTPPQSTWVTFVNDTGKSFVHRGIVIPAATTVTVEVPA